MDAPAKGTTMFSPDDKKIEEAPPLTIEERIAKGRATDRHYDGAIVPFPPGINARRVYERLDPGERSKVERWIAAGFTLTAFEYRSGGGELMQIVLRFDHPNSDKEIRQVRYCGKFERESGYWMTAIEPQRPLYGLDRLAARPEAPVLVVEGEKTADAAAKLFPDHVVITWSHGAYNVRQTEMLPLAGRNLVLWPDNDPPGRAAMRMFAAHAYAAGAVSAKIVDVPSEFGPKWDLADPVPPEHASENSLADLLTSARLVTASSVAHLTSDAQQQAEQRRLLGYEPGYTRVGIKHAETALSALDPDMYGNEWRIVARCIYYAYGDAGLGAFDSWSASGDKYKDGEPAKLWAGFAKESAFRARSLAWLFRHAGECLSERSVEEGALPNITLDADAVVIASVEELNEDHAVVMRGDKLAVLWETYDPRFERYTETYLSKRDFIDKYMRSVPMPADEDDETDRKGRRKKKQRTIKQGKLWFDTARRREYIGAMFAPKKVLGPDYLNLWRGFAVEPADNPNGWSRLKEHLLRHVAGGNQASYEYILNWLAFAVQHLDRPIGVALVLIGKKGAGKSIITELFGYLFGQHTFVTSRMGDVIDRFNARLETTALLGLEEAVAPQNRAADGTLKDLVTRPTLRLEGKFFGVWDAPNHLRIIATSNNEHVVRADGSERRYAVFDVDNPHQADPVKRRTYFGLMVEQMETGGYGAMLGELQSRNIRGWNPEIIPETPALKRQKVLNLVNDPVRQYLHDRLSEGEYIIVPSERSSTAAVRWSVTEKVTVPVRDLIEDFRDYAAAHGMRFSEGQFPVQLKKYMPADWRSVIKRRGVGQGASEALEAPGSTFRAYEFPPLEQARALFEEVTGMPIDRGV
jgi:hypothetical protein